MKKLLLTLTAVFSLGLAACAPGDSTNQTPTTSGVPQITGPLTTGEPGASLDPMTSGDPMASPDAMESEGM